MNVYYLKLATFGMSCFALLIALVINNKLRDGSGGLVVLSVPGFEIKLISEEIDIEKILSRESNQLSNKAIAKRVLGLYEIDHHLLREIENIEYGNWFAAELRNMQTRMRGPFYAPHVKVELAFSDQINIARAQVCADSMFLNQSLTIATQDGGSLDMIENANELLLHECPVDQREFEKIIVAEQFGARLLGTDKPPASVQVIAKAIPSIRFIHTPD